MNERIDGSRYVAQRLRELAEGIEGAQELWVDGQRLVASSEVSATVESALEGDGAAQLIVTIGLGSALRPQSHPLERELSWPGD